MTPCTCLRIAIIAEWVLFLSCLFLSGNYRGLTSIAILSLVLWITGTFGLFLLQTWPVFLYIGAKILFTRWWATSRENDSVFLQSLEMLNWFVFGVILFLVFFGNATLKSKL